MGKILYQPRRKDDWRCMGIRNNRTTFWRAQWLSNTKAVKTHVFAGKANRWRSKLMETCLYCGRHKKLIQLGEPVHTNEYDGSVHYLYICAKGQGCQKKYKDTWLGALRGSLYYDLPYLLVTLPCMIAINLFFVPNVNAAILRAGMSGNANSAVYFPLIIPVAGFFAQKFPNFLSMVITVAFGCFITR